MVADNAVESEDTSLVKPEPDFTEPSSSFRALVSSYSYSTPGPESDTRLRRSLRKRTPSRFKFELVEEEAGSLPSPPSATQNSVKNEEAGYLQAPPLASSLKRRNQEDQLEEDEKPRKKRKKRGYSGPETYAHLDLLADHLADDLDVVFCGINPGYDSARFGFHYAHATNHFWKCLYQGGFTPRLLPPSDGYLLPSDHNVGLTNLVERPSAEAAELSTAEFIASVPTLLSKIRRYRPRVVCFVGKVIWDAFAKVLRQHAPASASPKRQSPSLEKGHRAKAKTEKFTWGIQSFRMTHDCETGTVRETLFYVVPSTSARVVSHQLQDKVRLFAELKSLVDDLKASAFDSSSLVDVDVAAILGVDALLYQDVPSSVNVLLSEPVEPGGSANTSGDAS